MGVNLFIIQSRILELVFCGLHLYLTRHKLLNWGLCATTFESKHTARVGNLKKIHFVANIQLKTCLLGQFRQVNFVQIGYIHNFNIRIFLFFHSHS